MERKKVKSKYIPKGRKAEEKIKKVMSEFHSGKLRSGSKDGKEVGSRDQAIAIALSEARKVQNGKGKKIQKKDRKSSR